MRLCNRNTKPIWYANYSSHSPIINSDGFDTGEKTIVYDNPVQIRANVGGARGMVYDRFFGLNLEYDKVLLFALRTVPFSEASVLWIDVDPAVNLSGAATVPHDYIVKRISSTVNGTAVAVARVNANG